MFKSFIDGLDFVFSRPSALLAVLAAASLVGVHCP
jgi:hypothetical protein